MRRGFPLLKRCLQVFLALFLVFVFLEGVVMRWQ